MAEQLTKEQNIFNLYSKLSNNGAKGDAMRFVSGLCDTKFNTVKNHWFGSKELPDHVTEQKKDQIVSYLQKALYQQNSIKSIEVTEPETVKPN